MSRKASWGLEGKQHRTSTAWPCKNWAYSVAMRLSAKARSAGIAYPSSFRLLACSRPQGMPRARKSAYPVAVRLPCRCSLLLLESMPVLHHNACLESNHYLQTLMTDHASHLCVRFASGHPLRFCSGCYCCFCWLVCCYCFMVFS